jgi:hemerythrin
MEFNEWVSEHSVGDALMDSYHHIFFQGVEHIEEVAGEGNIVATRERVTFLLVYANMHFEAEEALLAKVGYPELEDHRAQHQAFRSRIQELQAQIEDDPSLSTLVEIARTAKGWWMRHILQEDMKYAEYLTRKK